ncbi:MAG: MFS transporter [Legionellales bacterium]|jgi:acyl-[acyl-carrier-protein]-phospholipid O-acyltransferase/long-chain-fatty-acid--[acyl-carrier-protein] ligase
MTTYKALLKRKDFSAFLCTQFLGAFNDNFYRMVVSLLIVHDAMTGEPLSIAAMIFIIPGLLFSGYAGFLADRFSKRSVLIWVRVASLLTVFMALFALNLQSSFLMLAILFAIATEAAFFSPAKYGILPESVALSELSYANGLLQTTTYIAILLGSVCGGVLVDLWGTALYKIGFVLIGIAACAVICSLGIPRVVASSARTLAINPWSEIILGFKHFFKHPLLFWVIMAIAYFWALGLAMQVNMIAWGHFTLSWSPSAIALMQVMLGLGIGVGSLIAGKMSGDQIEPGLIPLGALLMAVFLLFMTKSSSVSPYAVYFVLFCVGTSAGFYIVPLNALLQELPAHDQKGRMIATGNFVTALGMLFAAGITWLCYTYLQLNPTHLFLIFGVGTFTLFILTVKVFPDFFLRFLIWLVTHTLYRVRLVGYENFPKNGPVLIVCNHVSYIDGLILSGSTPRFIRYLILKEIYENKLFNWVFKLAHAIPIKEGEYDMVLAAFEKAREELRQGHVVCIFAEGTITRTGQLLPFRKGFERIMEGLDNVPIIPVHIDALWNSIFAYRGGRAFWKLPIQMPIKVTVSFGAAMPANSKATAVRQAVQELGAAVKFFTKDPRDTLSRRLLHTAAKRYFKFCMADPLIPHLTYGQFIGRALLLARYFRNQYQGETFIGVLMPPSTHAALINVAITLAGKAAINFPYTNAISDWQYFIDKSQVTVIISNRAFLQHIQQAPLDEVIYYEDLHFIAKDLQRRLAQWAVFWLPKNWILKIYGCTVHTTDTTAAVCFSKGNKTSTQGALLSHNNIIANVQSYSSILHLKPKDRVMGVLPFEGAYGYSLNLWLPLINGMGVAYHPEPSIAYEKIGAMMSQYKTTLIFDNIAHYTQYINEIRPSRFSYIRNAVVAGEALPDVLASAFAEQFALELLDSYGCVEMGPGIAMNVPDIRHPGRLQRGMQPGSVGRPLPGFAVKIVDPNTFKTLDAGQEGLLLVRGLGMMIGYLGEPRATQAAFHEGWYITGDLFVLNNDGFLFYKGRL